MDYSKITLGSLLSHCDTIIKRNALSILKRLQNLKNKKCSNCGETIRNGSQFFESADGLVFCEDCDPDA